ncbi:unnamed protein product [Trichobilharzia szidati]|nr:unnamed protein product [Trichobilharzia szidati]
MKIYCFLCLFLIVVIHAADTDVQLVNRRSAYTRRRRKNAEKKHVEISRHPKTTEPPVVTYRWMKINDNTMKYLFLLRNSSTDEWNELNRIVFEYIRKNKAYVPKDDPNAREKLAKADFLNKFMNKFGDDLSGLARHPKTTEPSVVTYRWMKINDNTMNIRKNKAYAPKDDPNAREKLAKADFLNKFMNKFGDDLSGLARHPKTTETPVVTYRWMKINDSTMRHPKTTEPPVMTCKLANN